MLNSRNTEDVWSWIKPLDSESMERRFKKLERDAFTIHEASIVLSFVGATNIILEGLKRELLSIILQCNNLKFFDEPISDAFEIAQTAISRLLLAAEIKSGSPRVAWLKHALENIEGEISCHD